MTPIYQRLFPLAWCYEQERQLWAGPTSTRPGTQGMHAALRMRQQLKDRGQ